MVSNEKDLIKIAQGAQKNAYAPYSLFKVGAALLSQEGRVYSGCNIENASFGATNCAERTAVFTAVCDGTRTFQKIVIVTDKEEPVMPCGICRQVLYEFSPNIEIIAVGSSGKIERKLLAEILPIGFALKKKE